MTDEQPPTRGCARCGTCCERITLSHASRIDPARWSTKALEGVADPGTEDGWESWRAHGWADDERDRARFLFDPLGIVRQDADFIAEHWHPIPDAPGSSSCDAFDPESRSCTAHDQRPPVCRNYPWYGNPPSAERAVHLELHCSYLGDLTPTQRPEGARPLIPIEAVTR